MRLALLLVAVLVTPAAATAAVSCTGECTTIEYRIDELNRLYDFGYNRQDNGFWFTEFSMTSYVPATGTTTEPNTGGTPFPAETAVVNALRNLANAASIDDYNETMDQWANRTADAGTTNTCSTGCECAEGTFTETTGSCGSLNPGMGREYIVEVNGQSMGYYATWMSSAHLGYTRRSKTVGCIALEP